MKSSRYYGTLSTSRIFAEIRKIMRGKLLATNLKLDVMEVKQKLNSLLGSFRREKSKGKKSIRTGKEVYISKWFAFERMQYLLNKDKPRVTMDIEKENNDEQLSENEQTLPDMDGSKITVTEIDQTDESESTMEQNKRIVSPLSPKRLKKTYDNKDDTRLEEAFNILKDTVAKKEADDCATYGKHVSNKLRRYNIRTRAKVEYVINNILFDADMGKYEDLQDASTSHFPQCNQKPNSALQYPQYTVPHFNNFNNNQTSSPLPSPTFSHASSTS